MSFTLANGQTFNGPNLKIEGDGNNINGPFATVKGHRNVITGVHANVTGSGNIVSGRNAYIKGNRNKVIGPNAIVRGDDNQVFGVNVDVQGFRNDVKVSGQRTPSTNIGPTPEPRRPTRTITLNNCTGINLSGGNQVVVPLQDGTFIINNFGDDDGDGSLYGIFSQLQRQHPIVETNKRKLEEDNPQQAKKKKLDLLEIELNKDDTPTETEPCIICAENKRCVTTECGHLFCRRCTRQLLKFKKECPTCRAKIVKEELRVIYL